MAELSGRRHRNGSCTRPPAPSGPRRWARPPARAPARRLPARDDPGLRAGRPGRVRGARRTAARRRGRGRGERRGGVHATRLGTARRPHRGREPSQRPARGGRDRRLPRTVGSGLGVRGDRRGARGVDAPRTHRGGRRHGGPRRVRQGLGGRGRHPAGRGTRRARRGPGGRTHRCPRRIAHDGRAGRAGADRPRRAESLPPERFLSIHTQTIGDAGCGRRSSTAARGSSSTTSDRGTTPHAGARARWSRSGAGAPDAGLPRRGVVRPCLPGGGTPRPFTELTTTFLPALRAAGWAGRRRRPLRPQPVPSVRAVSSPA